MAPIGEAQMSIVRCSSQDPVHRAENIFNRHNTNKKWLNNKTSQVQKMELEMHLSRAIKIAFVNIGNAGSAYVELLVGSSMWSSGTSYQTFLPSTTLMTPQDCKTGKNRECVKMLNKDVFCDSVRNEEWDRIQVICRQPFAKGKQFGLQFIHLVPADDSEKIPESPKQNGTKTQQETIEKFKSMLSPTSSQHNRMKRSPQGRGRLSMTPTTPSRGAVLIQAALSSNHGNQEPPTRPGKETRRRLPSSKLNTSPYPADACRQRGRTVSRNHAGDIEDEIECFLEGCKLGEMPQHLLRKMTYKELKENLESKRGCLLTKQERKIFLRLTAKAMLPLLNEEDELSLEPVSTSTPTGSMEEEVVYITTVEKKAVNDVPDEDQPSSMTRPTLTPPTSPTPSSHVVEDIGYVTTVGNGTDQCEYVPCPVCSRMFPTTRIQIHANFCVDLTCF